MFTIDITPIYQVIAQTIKPDHNNQRG